MSGMAFQITSLTIVYLIAYSGTDQRRYQSCVSLAFMRGIHRWPVNSPHKWPATRKSFHLMTSSWTAVAGEARVASGTNTRCGAQTDTDQVTYPLAVHYSTLPTRLTGGNTLNTRRNGRHFADSTFKCVFLNENSWTSIQISLKFVPSNRPVNSSPPGQNCCHFANDIFRYIFVNEKFNILIKISLKFVPQSPINREYPSIGSCNGLAPIRRQAIVWTNDDLVYWRIHASLVLDEFHND